MCRSLVCRTDVEAARPRAARGVRSMYRVTMFALGTLLFLTACGGGGTTNTNTGGNNGGGNTTPPPTASNTPFWSQWGANPQHSGLVAVAGQSAAHQLANIVYD